MTSSFVTSSHDDALPIVGGRVPSKWPTDEYGTLLALDERTSPKYVGVFNGIILCIKVIC